MAYGGTDPVLCIWSKEGVLRPVIVKEGENDFICKL